MVLRKLRKKLRKTKISFHEQHFAKKYIRFCEKLRKTHCVSCAKIAQKFAKKKLRENSAKDLAISWKPYKTLSGPNALIN